jgi:hypothetical protein
MFSRLSPHRPRKTAVLQGLLETLTLNRGGVKMGQLFFKFKKISEDERAVYANGKLIGRIYKGWNRMGGDGWKISNSRYPATSKTMKEAAHRMVREIKENAERG